MTVVVCEHVEDANPRHRGVCVRCGKTFTPAERPSMERDTDFEKQTLREAASKLGLEHIADALHAAADKRAHDGPVFLDRDLVLEAIEESLDNTGNYIVWELQRMMREGDDDHDRLSALWEALQHGILQYAALTRARHG